MQVNVEEALIYSLMSRFRHSGESRNLEISITYWMPAFAGMTNNEINQGGGFNSEVQLQLTG